MKNALNIFILIAVIYFLGMGLIGIVKIILKPIEKMICHHNYE